MELHPDKCVSISFTTKRKPIVFNYNINGNELERVGQVVDLGVTVTSELSFDPHIDVVCKKSARLLGMIRRAGREFSADTLRRLFGSLVRPVIE